MSQPAPVRPPEALHLLRFAYPGVVAVITVEAEGVRNVMPAGWHMPVSHEPPMWAVAVGHARFTHALLQKARAFVLQFFPLRHADWIIKTGRVSGRDVDKIRHFHLPVAPARTVEGFWIRGAYAVVECRFHARYPAGDHDIVVGEVVDGFSLPGALDEEGRIAVEGVNPALYLGRSMFLDLSTGKCFSPLAKPQTGGGS